MKHDRRPTPPSPPHARRNPPLAGPALWVHRRSRWRLPCLSYRADRVAPTVLKHPGGVHEVEYLCAPDPGSSRFRTGP